MMIEDKDFETLPEHLQWFVVGAIEVLSRLNDIKFHQEVRAHFFNKAKEYNDDTLKAFLIINKIDIDRMGL